MLILHFCCYISVDYDADWLQTTSLNLNCFTIKFYGLFDNLTTVQEEDTEEEILFISHFNEKLFPQKEGKNI